MPIPKPRTGETHDDFHSRCMSDLKDEFEDMDQRNAVCFGAWRDRNKKKGEADAAVTPLEHESEPEWMDRCMVDSEMIADYPDRGDRQQICRQMFNNGGGGMRPSRMDAMAEKVVDLVKHRADGNGFSIKASAKGAAKREAEILLYGEIGDDLFNGISAKTFAQELKAAGKLDKIRLRINSPGGSVFDGLAIYNTLRSHPAPVEVYIDGLAASAASLVAMAGDPLYMADNAILMIHLPWALTIGTADDMRAMAGSLDMIAQSMAMAYAKRSGKSLDEAAAWMAAETWFSAADALDLGLITAVHEPMKVAAHFDLLAWRGRYKHPPEELFADEDNRTPVSAFDDKMTALRRRMATATLRVSRELQRAQ